MRRRYRAHDPNSVLNLDSFMDIVTNVLGALFFVIIYAALSSATAKGKVTALMVSPGETEAIFFECRENTILFPDVDKLMEESNKLWEKLKTDGVTDWDERVEKLKDAKIGNSFCTYVPEKSLGVSGGYLVWRVIDTFVPVPGSLGETESELRQDGSTFRRELEKLDPKKHHIYFIAHTDSFEVFRAARRVALEQGFRVGWNPIGADEPIKFGSGGIDPGVQT